MRRVQWSRAALADLKRQAAHIGKANPEAARRVAARINEAAERLGTMPTGRPGRVDGTYGKSLPGLPYILAYAIEPGEEILTILRLIHAARRWPPGTWPR